MPMEQVTHSRQMQRSMRHGPKLLTQLHRVKMVAQQGIRYHLPEL